MTDDQNTPPQDPAPEPPDTVSGHAAYDTRLLRYVGGVHGKASDARQAAKDRGVASGDIRIDKV